MWTPLGGFKGENLIRKEVKYCKRNWEEQRTEMDDKIGGIGRERRRRGEKIGGVGKERGEEEMTRLEGLGRKEHEKG